MDKAKIFIEKHVQWLVLVIALLYVGLTVYSYIWTPPLKVNIGKLKDVKPGDIDETIKVNQVNPLLAEIADKSVNAPKVTNVLTDFDERLNERRTEVVDMKNPWDSPAGTHLDPLNDLANGGPNQGPKVTQLPSLPMAAFKASSSRRTVLLTPARKDTAYWSGRFTIDSAALAKEVAAKFGLPGIPPNIFQEEFAQVELFREEQLPNGTWGPPVEINSLQILEPFPKDSDDLLTKFKFQHWMDQNQAAIANPPFLPTAPDAEPWLEPGMTPPDLAPKPAGGAPVAPRRDAGGAPAPGGRPVATPSLAALDPAADPNAANAAGGFNAVVGNDRSILVHDITIEEGKTYRYAVRYKLYNPLFNNKVFANTKVSEQFAIQSPDPLKDNDPTTVAWSGPVVVDPSAYVFATKINQFTGQASFDIFEWKDGRWRYTRAVPNKSLTAGDPISGGQGVSKFMLVDVRKDTRNGEPNYAIVMDGGGALHARNERDDAVDPMYAKLKMATSAVSAR